MIDTKQYVIKQIEERNIRFLRLWFTDIFGNLKNVAITPSDIEIAFEEGIGFDGSSIDGLASLQDSDMLVHPDPSTFQVLPWRPESNAVARMFCGIRTPDGKPFEGDPRHVLARRTRRRHARRYQSAGPYDLRTRLSTSRATRSPMDWNTCTSTMHSTMEAIMTSPR